MAKYNITIKKSDTKELEKIDSKKTRTDIVNKINALGDEPRPNGAIKLSNDEKYRIRQGNFRILYQIYDDIVEVNVVRITDRKNVYKKRR